MTAEEFISLLEAEKQKAYEVLRPQIHPEILKFLVGGIFNDSRKRLVAYAIIPLDTTFYEESGYLFDYFEKSTLSMRQSDETTEKTRIYLDGGSFTYKSIQVSIEEGLYHQLLISFYGDFDFSEWNIMREYTFFDTKDIESLFQNILFKQNIPIKDFLFKSSIFQNTEEFFAMMNYPGRELEVPISTNMKPYIGHSHLVAIIRNERKTSVNYAYETYIKKAFFEPLSIKLKTHFPDKYRDITSFWAPGCDMMYPDHKQFCLMITFVIDKDEVVRLQCFVYTHLNNKLYEWTYFPPKPYEHYGGYSEALVDIFKSVSKCDHMDYIREPECTLDDNDFWNNYVFKKENGKYVYLKELKFD